MELDRSAIEEIIQDLDNRGSIFPNYRIKKEGLNLKLLGRGGFSSVYEIALQENMEECYALQVIGFEKYTISHEQFLETIKLQRMLSEDTSHVVRVLVAKEILVLFHENGEIKEIQEHSPFTMSEEGLCIQFILMEKVEDIIRKEKRVKMELMDSSLMEEENVISFAMQIGRAIHEAHRKHILHRDIKLENIFWDAQSKTYKLGDFGIAKLLNEGNAETILYTNGYGAPEIENKKSYSMTADIYSFGITLYLLLNDLSFPGSEGYYPNKIQYHPDFVFPAPMNGSVAMTRIIRKMCSYEKEERYQTMEEVLLQLSAMTTMEDHPQEVLDLEENLTETYREKKVMAEQGEGVLPLSSRAQRKKDKIIDREIEVIENWKYGIALTITFVLFISGVEQEILTLYPWEFFVLSAMVLVEGILLRVKELYVLFGSVVLGALLYAMWTMGMTALHVVLLLGVCTQLPMVAFSSAVSVVVGTQLIGYIEQYETIPMVKLVSTHEYSIMIAIMAFWIIQRITRTKEDFGEHMEKGNRMKLYICGTVLPFIILVRYLLGLI